MKAIAAFACLLLLLIESAAAQTPRNRAAGPVTFYAAPNGVDTGNDCLSPAAPCTASGAVGYFALSYDRSGIIFSGAQVANQQNLNGPPQCIADLAGLIITSGTTLPCTVTKTRDGKVY